MRRDAVDVIVGQWHKERPDLDLTPMATIGRLGRVVVLLTRRIEAELERHGLKVGEFDVLASLRRQGPPYELTPGAMIRQLMLSSGAMTNRIDRLEQQGYVERRPDPADRRGVVVRLTATGNDVLDRAVTDHVANERRLLAELDEREIRALERVTRKLLASLEPPDA